MYRCCLHRMDVQPIYIQFDDKILFNLHIETKIKRHTRADMDICIANRTNPRQRQQQPDKKNIQKETKKEWSGTLPNTSPTQTKSIYLVHTMATAAAAAATTYVTPNIHIDGRNALCALYRDFVMPLKIQKMPLQSKMFSWFS